MKTRTQFVTMTKIKTRTLVGVGVVASIAFMAAALPTMLPTKKAATIQVVSPNGGEQWQTGGTYVVTWQNYTNANVRIELIKNSSFITSWGPIANGATSYKILIPSSLQTGSDYKIRITTLDKMGAADYRYYDDSDAPFRIVTALTPACIDTDGGILPDRKGTVTFGSTLQTDTCVNCTGVCPIGGPCPPPTCGAVVEYYCGPMSIFSDVITCNGKCIDGACEGPTILY